MSAPTQFSAPATGTPSRSVVPQSAWERYPNAAKPRGEKLPDLSFDIAAAKEELTAAKVDTSKPITVEAIKGLPLEKDLIVDMEPFFQSYREIMPFLISKGHEPTKERYQSAEDHAKFDDTTKCILCAACTSSCPVFWTDGQYFGPAAIVNAHRFIFDSRDDAGDMRLEILNDKEGVWRCRTTFNCSEACPRGIQVTKAIAEVKQAILSRTI